MSTFDSHDQDIARELGGIQKAIENLTDAMKEMKAAWDKRVERRDREKELFDARLSSLERTRSQQYGALAVVGALFGILGSVIIRVLFK